MTLARDSISPVKPIWPGGFWKRLLSGPPAAMMHPESAGYSIIGGRKENQDRCLCDDDAAIYLVADGMGGHAGGARASEIAVDVLSQHLRAASTDEDPSEAMERALHRGLENASREMRSFAATEPDCGKMGCTLAAVAIVGNHAYYTHVGDSRVYLIHEGHIKRLTKDETLVEELADANLISRSSVATHRWRHVVTNSLGARGIRQEPRWKEMQLCDGDQILLTSDGLTNELTDAEIESEVRRSMSPKQSVKGLIRAALHRDPSDNVTCVVTKMQPDVSD
ncbi:MAG: protein phosphatase 2C domain-containing protein [Planctomycetota bacterium]